MTKLMLSIAAAIGFFRVLDAAGPSAAVLYALGVLSVSVVVDLGSALARKMRGPRPPIGRPS